MFDLGCRAWDSGSETLCVSVQQFHSHLGHPFTFFVKKMFLTSY